MLGLPQKVMTISGKCSLLRGLILDVLRGLAKMYKWYNNNVYKLIVFNNTACIRVKPKFSFSHKKCLFLNFSLKNDFP